MKNAEKLEAKIARLETEMQDLIDSMPVQKPTKTITKNEVLPKRQENLIQK
jgi:hypothetical protein